MKINAKKNLIIFLFIFILFFSSSIISAYESQNITSLNPIWTDYNTSDPGITSVSFGINLVVGNSGEEIVRDIEWTSTFYSENGRIIFGDGEHGARIPALNPGEKYIIEFRPFPSLFRNAYGWSPIGFGKISLAANAVTSTGDSASGERTALLFGPFIILD